MFHISSSPQYTILTTLFQQPFCEDLRALPTFKKQCKFIGGFLRMIPHLFGLRNRSMVGSAFEWSFGEGSLLSGQSTFGVSMLSNSLIFAGLIVTVGAVDALYLFISTHQKKIFGKNKNHPQFLYHINQWKNTGQFDFGTFCYFQPYLLSHPLLIPPLKQRFVVKVCCDKVL